jgi:PAS domain S-box-containing protein
MIDERNAPTPDPGAPGDLPEAALREAYKTLRELIEGIPNILIILDRDFRIVGVNRVVASVSREALVGKSGLDSIGPEDRAAVMAHWERVLATGEPSHYETTASGPDGTLAYYSAHIGPLRRGGEIAGLVISTMDITDRKRLEETTRAAVARAEASAAELAEKNRQLSLEMAERAQAERTLVSQREALRALSTPILKLWDGVLALPVIGLVDSARAAQMMERLLEEIVRSGARSSILDLTGVELVDTSTASYLLKLVRAAALLGSRCLVSGISPTVAQAMVHLEVGLENIQTFGTLEDALRHAIGASDHAARGPGAPR